MKPETLEVLLVDRALGELPPEVVELLESHLAHNPEAARQADQLAFTLQLARQAGAMEHEVPGRPLAVERLWQAHVSQRWRSMVWGFAKLAACLLLGLVLGWFGHIPRRADVAATPVPLMAPAVGLSSALKDAGDFWSLAHFEAAQRERQPVESRTTSRYRLHWDSPVKMPRVEENL
jgi:hypothetical protein